MNINRQKNLKLIFYINYINNFIILFSFSFFIYILHMFYNFFSNSYLFIKEINNIKTKYIDYIYLIFKANNLKQKRFYIIFFRMYIILNLFHMLFEMLFFVSSNSSIFSDSSINKEIKVDFLNFSEVELLGIILIFSSFLILIFFLLYFLQK